MHISKNVCITIIIIIIISTNYNNLAQYVVHISKKVCINNNYNYNNLATNYNNLAQYVMHISKMSV